MLVYVSGLAAYIPFMGIFKLGWTRPYKIDMRIHQIWQKRYLPVKNGDAECYENQPKTTFKRARILPQHFEETFPI